MLMSIHDKVCESTDDPILYLFPVDNVSPTQGFPFSVELQN